MKCNEIALSFNWKKHIGSVKALAEKNFTFAIQTDTHVDFDNSSGKNWSPKDAGTNLKLFAKETGLDFYANLGDIIEGYPNDSILDMRNDMTELMQRYTEKAPCPVVVAFGNHDSNHMWAEKHGGEIIGNEELLERIMIPVKKTSDNFVFPGNVAYYYIDFDNVRVIVLNTQDGKNTEEFVIGPSQLNWLENDALSTKKPIIVMAHAPLALELSENKTEGAEKALSLICDFKNNGGCVVGCFYGHLHRQSSVCSDGINHICFSNLGIRAEVVAVDFSKRIITTKCVGDVEAKDGTIFDRKFEF